MAEPFHGEMDVEPEPQDTADSRALTRVVSEGDPETMLVNLEKKAALAARMRQAIETVLISQTYPEDWTVQGKHACLSSAGAERIARTFPISYSGVEWEKEEFIDGHGAGYRYTYHGYAALEHRTVFVHGSYSTRDKFLGFANGEWKAVEDINEGHIRNAAYHVFCGNAIKELLGLRGVPKSEYERIMGRSGRDASRSSNVQRGQGTQGGTGGDDHAHQVELGEICMAIANAGCTVLKNDDGKTWSLATISESDERAATAIASEICAELSGFEGDNGPVQGKASPKQLRGKWLNSTLGKARELKTQLANLPGF